MDNKYNELEKLNQLKANGTITDAEFEIQKYKILNTTTETKIKKNKSKIFFILTSISTVVTIIWGMFLYIWNDTLYTEFYFKNNNIDLVNSMSGIFDTILAILVITTIVMLILGIIFKIKEKGGIKIVD